jgi:outer membrane protein with beta-barrel domain
MRRVLMGIAAAVLLVAGSGIARSEEGARVEMGVKMWLNNWRHSDPRLGENIRSDIAMLLGPAIEAKFGDHLIAEASFLFSVTDYTFSNSNTINDGRQDADIAIGYLIVPRFGVLAGYKNTSLRERETGITQTLAGPLIGVVARVPLDQETSVYTMLNYLFTKHEEAGVTEDSPGWNFEFGIQYRYTKDFAGSIGYKYETNTGANSNVEDIFSGLTLGAMLAF